MATDYRTFAWGGQPIATAQASPPSGFTQGMSYQIKGAAVDNVTGAVVVLMLNDAHQAVAVTLPANFTFQ